jgi:hypothetical protein
VKGSRIIPDSVLKSFAAAEAAIQQSSWYDARWSCCSGLWRTDRYGDTVVLRLTKKNWSSVFPVSVDEGGEIQYAAWIDEKLHRRSTVRFEMHVFSFLSRRNIRKRDFTLPFRQRNGLVIRAFGFHDTDKGPNVPYGGAYRYKDLEDLNNFLVRDFANFASLADSIDEHLALICSR